MPGKHIIGPEEMGTNGATSGHVLTANASGQPPTYQDQLANLAGDLTATHVANHAANDVVAGIPVVHTVTVPDGTTGNVDVTVTHKIQVLDAWLVKTAGAGGASDTIQVKNAANAISNALDINVSDQVVVRAGTLDDAYTTIAAGGTLRITRTKSSGANVACLVNVLAVRVA